MERHRYSVFITHGVQLQFDHEPSDDELYDMAVDVLMRRAKDDLLGGSDFEHDKWDVEEL
jgi:hypothetical protein